MRKSMWLISAGLAALSTPAFAQDAEAPQPAAQADASAQTGAVDNTAAQEAPPAETGDIVITATRRNEALSDVPIAVSAVSGDTLRNSGATDIRQLNQVSPSLLVSSTSSEAGGGVARIRGIGTVGDNAGLESSVALFIDGVYRSRTATGLSELGPIDRIEVLRGPQGTLFGRNASAGLISVITKKPRFENSAEGELTIGNYDYRRAQLGLNGIVTDTLAARIDGVWMTRDGFVEDQISGRTINDRDRYMVRGQALYQPNSDLSLRLIADFTKRNEECCAGVYQRTRDYTINGEQPSTVRPILESLGGIILDDPKDRDVTVTPGRDFDSRVKDAGLSGELSYDLGNVNLTSITAYRYNNAVRGQDVDFNNVDILYRDDDGGFATRFKTFTQEVRFNGKAFNGKLDWLVGGFYANEKLRQVDNLTYGDDYTAYSNCLTAYKLGYALFAAGLNGTGGTPNATTLPNTANPASCLNTATAGQIATLYSAAPGALGASARAIGLLAGFAPGSAGTAGYDAVARQLQLAFGLPTRPGLNGIGLSDEYNQTSNNWALFTHNIFSVTDRMKLSVGLRYTSETKRLKANLTDNNTFCQLLYSAGTSGVPALAALAGLQTLPCVIPSVPGGEFNGDEKKKEGKLSGTINLSYKPIDPLLVYASYSRGYKAGGFNLDRSAFPRFSAGVNPLDPAAGQVLPTATLADLEFKPEINDAFELGAKYNGRGLDINVAVFHQLFRDFQLNAFNGINFQVENINSCSDDLDGADSDATPTTGACTGKTRAGVRSQGVELEIFSRPMRDVTLNLGGIYSDTKYRKNLVGADGRALSPNFFQLPGRQLSNSSEVTATASAAWTPRIGDSGLRGLLYMDYRYTGRLNTGSDLDIEKIQKAFNVVNARVGVTGPDKNWAIELWAQNLFNETYTQVAFDMPLQGYGTGLYSNTQRGVDTGRYPRANQLFGQFLGEPRTVGLTLRGRIGGPRAASPVYVAPEVPAPAPVATQTCYDGSVIEATATCPVPPQPAPTPAPTPGERG